MTGPRRRTVFSVVAGVGALITAVVMTLWRVPTTFNVVAQSEWMSVHTALESGSAWSLNGVNIRRDYDDSVGVEFTGSFLLAPGVEITIERVAFGPIKIRCVTDQEGSVGTLYQADDPVGTLGTHIEFIIDGIGERAATGENVVLPILGTIDVGQRLADAATSTGHAMLRSGSVRLLGRSVIGASLYEAGTYTLDPGDRFEVSEPDGLASGFVLADERPGFTTVFRVVGNGALVTRRRAKGYLISASLRSRILNDRGVQGIWLTFVALIAFGRRFTKKRRA